MRGLSSLQTLVFELEKLPGLGPRSAQRLAQHLLGAKDEDIKRLSYSLLEIKNKIKKCVHCFHLTQDKEICSFCDDSSRASDVLCVVEQPFDVFRIEKSGVFKGCYHVLHGAISPLNHVHPKDLTLKELKERIEKQSVKELILAIDSDLEGDTTALYIMQNLRTADLKISRLAQGIPFGSDLAFVDDKTLSRAIENRSYC